MSRSYKKTPYSGDRKNRETKRIANHKVRQRLKNSKYEIRTKSRDYRKFFDSYEICDYGWICTWEEFWKRELRHYNWARFQKWFTPADEPNYEESYRYWCKWYKRK